VGRPVSVADASQELSTAGVRLSGPRNQPRNAMRSLVACWRTGCIGAVSGRGFATRLFGSWIEVVEPTKFYGSLVQLVYFRRNVQRSARERCKRVDMT
jgi:hypothetical protein